MAQIEKGAKQQNDTNDESDSPRDVSSEWDSKTSFGYFENIGIDDSQSEASGVCKPVEEDEDWVEEDSMVRPVESLQRSEEENRKHMTKVGVPYPLCCYCQSYHYKNETCVRAEQQNIDNDNHDEVRIAFRAKARIDMDIKGKLIAEGDIIFAPKTPPMPRRFVERIESVLKIRVDFGNESSKAPKMLISDGWPVNTVPLLHIEPKENKNKVEKKVSFEDESSKSRSNATPQEGSVNGG